MTRDPYFPDRSAEPTVAPPMVYVSEKTAWEYKQIARSLARDELPDEAELNALGADGWELAGILADSSSAHFYFKRLKSV